MRSGDSLGEPGAFVNAGEIGFELIEATLEDGTLAIQGDHDFVVVGIQFVGHGEIAGADAIADGGHGLVEFGAGNVVGFGTVLAGEDFFDDEDRAGDEGGGGGPEFGGEGARSCYNGGW